jgi:hypothetical protein
MGRAEVDFIFYQSASLEPSRQQFKGFFDGFQNIREDNRVDWEKLKGLYPCTLPHEALQFELHNVKVDPSTREEYKSFLNSCMVPADTTLTGQWLEGGTRPILANYYYARCLDFGGKLMPCIREPQDAVYRNRSEDDDYTGGPVFTSIDSIATRRWTTPSGDVTTVQLSTLDIDQSSKLSDRALAYTRFKPRWDVLDPT